MTSLPYKHLYLVDGSGYIFRAYFAIPPRSTADGTPTNATFGFTNMLIKLLRDSEADALAVIFDKSSKSFRNEIYGDYKAQRPDPPEDLVPQFAAIREATKAFNLPCIEMEGYEADDLIATYARQAKDAGAEVTIVSSDKDLMQLVDGGIAMLDPMKDKAIDQSGVRERFGVAPERVVDVQAIAGDNIDNVPGVAGIGEKIAIQLVQEFGDLDAILNLTDGEVVERLKVVQTQADELAGEPVKLGSAEQVGRILFDKLGLSRPKGQGAENPKAKTEVIEDFAASGVEFANLVLRGRLLGRAKSSLLGKLRNNQEMARISKRLVTLERYAPVEEGLDGFGLQEPEPETLRAFLERYEFRSVLRRLSDQLGGEAAAEAAPEAPPPGEAKYELVQDLAALERWVAAAPKRGVLAVDTETTSLDAVAAELVGISLATEAGKACYIPLAHKGGTPGDGGLDLEGGDAEAPKQIPLKDAIAAVKPLLEDPGVLKIGQNIKYDMLIFARQGIQVAPIDDTMLLSYVLDGGLHGHKLDDLAQIHLDHQTIKFKEVAGTGKNQVTFDYVPLDKALDYAAEDADITLRLHQSLKPRLVSERMTTVYETIERPLVPVLAQMELTGIKADRDTLRRMSNDFATRIGELEEEIHKLAGRPFTIGSPKQLGEILFDEMSLPGGKKGKSGAYATGADVLEGLAAQGHDLPARVLDWRQLAKLKSTYTDALQTQINEETGRVHTSYSQAVASTGRLSSNDPNLQNIPIRTEEGRKIRTAFVAEKGHVLLSVDYSQIELRLTAHIAEVDALKQAFHEGQDIHAITAAQVFDIPVEGMDPMVRRKAKAINFGIIYGISAFGLAQNLGIPQGEARAYIEAYFKRYPGIRGYMDRTKTLAREQGVVTTLFGRKIHIPGIKDKNPARRSFSERAAINAPIQGTAADIIKRAMIRVPPALTKAGLGAKMLLQVHDELLFEVPETEVEETSAVVRAVMEQACAPAVELSVPLVADAGTGANWAEAH
ncbi:DNA polymerase I [Pelagibius sp.]|uniref:DNA polymerase I n=1 Tax=Pelagibius sp. TaxID=1931238 RepID=UPI0026287FE2|nr:DNA polymerase I [Pelagibius sp.]